MSSYKRRKTIGDTDWFVHDRFGMFIHFGLYSLNATHEWIKTLKEIPEEHYDKYFEHFNPDLFDAREWARKAKAAGMKYAVLTTKHHEGFCLFDSQYTDYKITNTQFGRDLVREYVEAFRAEGLKVGFYYSLLDWHHPHYQIDIFHPLRNHPDAEEMNKTRDMNIYREYMFNQVREILTNYGKIDILWFDFTYPSLESIDLEFNKFAIKDYKEWMPWASSETWDAENLCKMVREINPDIILNNRTGIEQDITTPEQAHVATWPEFKDTHEKMTWEVCHTFSGAWGYARDEMSWKSPETLIRILISCVSTGGNLIMNVGPCARGVFDKRADKALSVYEEWMRYNSRSIYGCEQAEEGLCAPCGTMLTQSTDGKCLYIHLVNYPYSELVMENIADRISYAQFLHDGSEMCYRKNDDNSVNFIVPGIVPDMISPVIEVFLD